MRRRRARSGASAAGGSDPQSTFELQPIPTPGLTEYTIEIDGQALRYRNGPQEWATFIWPNARGPAGARITAVGSDGRSVEVTNFPGKFGLERFISSAQKQRNGDLFTLTWTNGSASVSANFRLISNSAPTAPAAGEAQAGGSTAGLRNLRLPTTVVGSGAGA